MSSDNWLVKSSFAKIREKRDKAKTYTRIGLNAISNIISNPAVLEHLSPAERVRVLADVNSDLKGFVEACNDLRARNSAVLEANQLLVNREVNGESND